MESKELRIGNLYMERCTKTVIEVIEITKEAVYFSGEFRGNWQAEPIPLTEEWLLKFGFECVHKANEHYQIQNPKGYKDLHKIHIFKTIGDSWHLAFSDTTTDKDYTPPCHFQNIHQLQNLYKALTGEELEIKTK